MAGSHVEDGLVGGGQVDVHLWGEPALVQSTKGSVNIVYTGIRTGSGIGSFWWVALPVQVDDKEGDGEDEEDQQDERERHCAVLHQEEVIRCHKD